MKICVFKSIALAVVMLVSCNAEAQFLKKLKDKVNRKIEQKVEQKVDKTLEDLTSKKEKKKEKKVEMNSSSNATTGSAIIKHGKRYGSFNIDEFGKATIDRNNDEVRVYGSWVTHAADIHDGYILVIPNGNVLLYDNDTPKKGQIKLQIPSEATLELSYDPIWDANLEDENGFSSAMTKDYQSYKIVSGEITIDVFGETNVQISFSGNSKLVTRVKNPDINSEDDYLLTYESSSISGAIDVSPLRLIDSRTVEKIKTTPQQPKLPNTSNMAVETGIYSFSFETKVRVTNLDDNQIYNMSYLLNPNTKYLAIKVNMEEYSDEETDGESIIVMDDGDAHIFVETQGMKMRMSSGMMRNQKQQMPSEQMMNYDYTNLTKTGKTKTILGATCYEYIMADDKVKIELWAAPDVNLPNWFIQNQQVLKGYIMEYTVTSNEGNMKSETTAIHDNISKTLNPKEYRKMF